MAVELTWATLSSQCLLQQIKTSTEAIPQTDQSYPTSRMSSKQAQSSKWTSLTSKEFRKWTIEKYMEKKRKVWVLKRRAHPEAAKKTHLCLLRTWVKAPTHQSPRLAMISTNASALRSWRASFTSARISSLRTSKSFWTMALLTSSIALETTARTIMKTPLPTSGTTWKTILLKTSSASSTTRLSSLNWRNHLEAECTCTVSRVFLDQPPLWCLIWSWLEA